MHRRKVLQVIGHMVEATNPGVLLAECAPSTILPMIPVLQQNSWFPQRPDAGHAPGNVHGIGPRCRVIQTTGLDGAGGEGLGTGRRPADETPDGLGEISAQGVELYPVINPASGTDPRRPYVGVKVINSCLTCGGGSVWVSWPFRGR